MNFTRNSIAAVVAVVASMTAGTAAVAMNLGGAETGVPSPAGQLTAATTSSSTSAAPAVPATIYIDEPVYIPAPAAPADGTVSSGSGSSPQGPAGTQ